VFCTCLRPASSIRRKKGPPAGMQADRRATEPVRKLANSRDQVPGLRFGGHWPISLKNFTAPG